MRSFILTLTAAMGCFICSSYADEVVQAEITNEEASASDSNNDQAGEVASAQDQLDDAKNSGGDCGSDGANN